MQTFQNALLDGHEKVSDVLGTIGTAKGNTDEVLHHYNGGQLGVPEDSTSSTWSTDSDKEIKKRLLLKKRSWGEQTEEEDHEAKHNEHLMTLFSRFMIGLALSQGFYLLLTFHSKWKPEKAIWSTGILGFPIALGMAFSKTVRVIVYLLLPSFCTAKGRTVILAFCLMLVLTGPSENIAHNYRQISSSLTCGDELGYNMTQGLRALVHDGQNAILSTMEDTVDAIIDAVETAQDAFKYFAKKLQSLAGVVKGFNKFIRNMGNVCNAKLGAFLCIVPNFVAKQAKKLITDPLKNAMKRVREEFNFTMSYSHEFKYDVNASKTSQEITDDIMAEVKASVSGITDFFNWMRFAMAFSTFFVILKAAKYSKVDDMATYRLLIYARYKYLTKIEFDNCYITEEFDKLDNRRRRRGKLGVLPLRARENSTYIKPTRIWMSRPELKRFTKGLVSITFNLGYTLAVIFVDYNLWWLLREVTVTLSLRRQARTLLGQALGDGFSKVVGSVAGSEEAGEIAATIVGLSVSGFGFVTLIYRAIASGIQRLANAEGYDFSIDKCLPKPRAPDYAMYLFILSLYLLLYVICLTEAYILRSRRRIMAAYHPRRERARIMFLRTKILAKRGIVGESGIMNAVKQAALKMQKSKAEDEYRFLAHYANRQGVCGFIARILTGRTKYRCDICKLAGGVKHRDLFKRCPTFGCTGVYCIECYSDLHKFCIKCLIKESVVIKERRRASKDAGRVSGERRGSVAEALVDSSGISDSSEDSSSSSENCGEQEEEEGYDEEARVGRRERRVRFRDKVDTKYMSLTGSGSEEEEEDNDDDEEDNDEEEESSVSLDSM